MAKTAAAIKPDFQFLRSHPAHLIALGFGSGLSPWMPGTAGTLLGWALFALLNLWLTPTEWAALLVGGFVLGQRACAQTGIDLNAPDHGAMVWDEIVAFWFVLVALQLQGPLPLPVPAAQQMLATQALAFVVFRAFDILKPPPIRQFEARFKTPGPNAGFGVMADDLLAAGYTLLVFTAARSL